MSKNLNKGLILRKHCILFLLFLSTILVINTVIIKCQEETLLKSNWLHNSVVLDGKITSSAEWSDTASTDAELGMGDPVGPPFVSARIWVKNDGEWLYLLFKVPWLSSDVDVDDAMGISFYWGPFENPWLHFDASLLEFSGYPSDTYRYNCTGDMIADTDYAPPGQNNLEGFATHDGTHYWFEMRKALSSGDGYDWSLETGRTYGLRDRSPDSGGDLHITLWDESLRDQYYRYVRLNIATPTDVQAENTPTTPLDPVTDKGTAGIFTDWSLREVVYLISITGTLIGVISWVNRNRKEHRKQEIVFNNLLSEIDDIYTRFGINSRKCETELIKLRNNVIDEFKQGVLDEDRLETLIDRIDQYLNEINET
jgi:hypothetical protein